MLSAQTSLAGNVSNCDGAWDHWPRCCVSTPVMALGLAAAIPQVASLALWSLTAVRGAPSVFFRVRSAFDLVLIATVGGSYCVQTRDYRVHVHHVLHSFAMAALHGSCLGTLALVVLKYLEAVRPRIYVSMATPRACQCVSLAVVVSSVCVGGVVYASFHYSSEPVWAVETPIHLGFFALPYFALLVLNCLLAKILFNQFGIMCSDITDEDAPLRRSVCLCTVVTSFVSFMVYPFQAILFIYSDKCIAEVQITTHVMISWINFALYLFIVEPFQNVIWG